MRLSPRSVAVALLLAASSGVMASGVPDACGLLTAAEIAAVQEATLVEAKASASREEGAAVSQCYFQTDPPARSVSLRWVTAAKDGDRDAARERWQEIFHGEREEEERDADRQGKKEGEEEERPPQPVAGLGDEAFWTGGAAAGALYVLAGDSFLRVSVGGVSDGALRIEKTKQLAAAALRRVAKRTP
jgi:hypothetical protein